MSDEIERLEKLEREYREAKEASDTAQDRWRALNTITADKKRALTAAQAAAAPPHEWEGRIVTRGDRKKTPGSSVWRPVYVPVTVRGVVETYRDQPLQGTGLSHYGTDIGDPLVRILTASGKPGKKLEKLIPFRIDGSPIWTLEETA